VILILKGFFISLTEYTEDTEIKDFSIAVEKDGNEKALSPAKSGAKSKI